MGKTQKQIGSVLIIFGFLFACFSLPGRNNEGFAVFGIAAMIVGWALARETATEKQMKIEQAKAALEANARARIRDIFVQAGNNTSDEVEEKAKLAETLLKQGAGDWTEFGPTKISEIIQGVEALKGKKQ
jgi:hypothetical protein